MTGNSWDRSELLVMDTLKRVESKLDEQAKDITNLKIKCAIYGVVGAAALQVFWTLASHYLEHHA